MTGDGVGMDWATNTDYGQFCKDDKAWQCHNVWTIRGGQTWGGDLHENHSRTAGQHGRSFSDMIQAGWSKVPGNASIFQMVNFEIFLCYPHTLVCFLSPSCNFWLVFKHFPTKKICIFCSLSNPKTIRIRKGQFLQITLPEKLFRSNTQMVISQKVRRVWTWFWYQTKAERVLLTMIPKTHFTQNVTCSLFCWSVSQRLCCCFPVRCLILLVSLYHLFSLYFQLSVQSIFLIGVYAILVSISHNAMQCNGEYYKLTNQIVLNIKSNRY